MVSMGRGGISPIKSKYPTKISSPPITKKLNAVPFSFQILHCIKTCFQNTYNHSIEKNSLKIIKEGFVVQGVCCFKYYGWQEIMEEEIWGELWEMTIQFSIFH